MTSRDPRFGPLVTRLCGGLYTLSMFLYMGIVVYMPALALEQVRSLSTRAVNEPSAKFSQSQRRPLLIESFHI